MTAIADFSGPAARMRSPLAWIGLVTVLLVLLGVAAGPTRRLHVCTRIGICKTVDPAATMLKALQEQPLRLLRARFVVPISVGDTPRRRRIILLPAQVDYLLDFGNAPAGLDWRPHSAMLRITPPPITMGPLQPDWPAAQQLRGGLLQALPDAEAEKLAADSDLAAVVQAQLQAQATTLAPDDDYADALLRALFATALDGAGHPEAKIRIHHAPPDALPADTAPAP